MMDSQPDRTEKADTRLQERLDDIAREMRALSLWSDEPPPASAFVSQKPFFVDTMSFPEWLQFVMLPRLQALIDEGQPMPASADIAPMAEEYFKNTDVRAARLINLIREMDLLITHTP